jgi:photosystem II stability/assembly factor-like uncharacterized protein
MNRVYLILLVVCFYVVQLSAQPTNWEKMPDTYGGEFITIVQVNDTLYTHENLSPGNLHVSYDEGAQWKKIQIPTPPGSGSIIHLSTNGNFISRRINFTNNDTLYFFTSNKGLTWDTVQIPNHKLFIELSNSTWLVLTKDGWIKKSFDHGDSWQNVQYIGAGRSHFREVENGKLLGYIEPETDSTKLLYSGDYGNTWNFIPISHRLLSNHQKPSMNTTFMTSQGVIFYFPLTVNGSFFRSTNGGATFEEININNFYPEMILELSSGRLIAFSQYSGTCSGYTTSYFSDDQGATWHTPSIETIFPLFQKETNNDFIFCLSTTNGVYKSPDGNNWKWAGKGLIGAGKDRYYLKTRVINDSLYYHYMGSGVWRNKGNQSELKHIEGIMEGVMFFNTNLSGEKLYITSYDQRLYYSENYGDSIREIILPNAEICFYSINDFGAIPDTDTLYISSFKGFFISPDKGINWYQKYNEPIVGFMIHPSGRLICQNYNTKKFIYSDDNGETWHQSNDSGAFDLTSWNGEIKKISPSGVIYVFRSAALQSDKAYLWKSYDAGLNWIKCPSKLSEPESFFVSDNEVLYVLGAGTVYTSADEGLSWQALNLLSDYGIHHITVSPSSQKIYACVIDLEDLNLKLFRSTTAATQGAFLYGKVEKDADGDCGTEDPSNPLTNWIVKAENAEHAYFIQTAYDGSYTFFIDTGFYEVSAAASNEIWWQGCNNLQVANLDSLFSRDTANFLFTAQAECPLMSVQVSAPFLRRCFTSAVYVNYCNVGTVDADSAYVDVTLDPYLSITSAPLPYVDLGNHSYRFYLDPVPFGTCGDFQLNVYTACGDSTVLGQTHCIVAHGFPDSLCAPAPNWSGAYVEANATCQDSIIHLKLQNTGNAASQELEYIIIEDDIVLFQDNEEYDPQEIIEFDFPANGKTWRIESEQEPGHPFSSRALAFDEGCAGFASLGFITRFSVNGWTPSIHQFCIQNQGSYDPNDKQGFPTGSGEEHNIRPNTKVDYLIRFQNTGTDTAFTVVVRDTLSPLWDPTTFQMGPTSHPVIVKLSGEGILAFEFYNINLPDSSTNLAASQGFLQFSIQPYEDVPLGSVLENKAHIYFDFNEAITTNTTWHTLSLPSVSGSTTISGPQPTPTLKVSPNPFVHDIQITTIDEHSGPLTLTFYDNHGRAVLSTKGNGTFHLHHDNQLLPGLYQVEIRDENNFILGSGKVLKK